MSAGKHIYISLILIALVVLSIGCSRSARVSYHVSVVTKTDEGEIHAEPGVKLIHAAQDTLCVIQHQGTEISLRILEIKKDYIKIGVQSNRLAGEYSVGFGQRADFFDVSPAQEFGIRVEFIDSES